MSYTNTIKTKTLDPEFFNSTQGCEFRLNDINTTYLSSMYLGNVGAFGSDGNRNVIKYNPYGGVKNLIKDITLYDGGNVLAQLQEVGPWVAFKSQNQDNSDARSKQLKELGNAALFNVEKATAVGPERIGAMNHPIADGVGEEARLAAAESGTPAGHPGTGRGYFDIRDLLKELNTISSLDTNVFKNLRLVINWELDPLKFADRASATAVGTDPMSSIKATQPILVVDCIKDMATRTALLDNIKNVAFTSIENDRVVINEIAPTGVDIRQSTVLKGFDNKVLNRVLLVNNPVSSISGVVSISGNDTPPVYFGDSRTLYAGKNNSIAQYKLRVQMSVNGQNLFNGEGLEGSSVRQAVCTDTWGDMIANWGSNKVGICVNQAGAFGTLNTQEYFDPRKVQFGGDYTGFKVQDRVKYLELAYTRSGVAAGSALVFSPGTSNIALNVIVYGEVAKMLVIDGTNYRVSYM
mgnify:FL=1